MFRQIGFYDKTIYRRLKIRQKLHLQNHVKRSTSPNRNSECTITPHLRFSKVQNHGNIVGTKFPDNDNLATQPDSLVAANESRRARSRALELPLPGFR